MICWVVCSNLCLIDDAIGSCYGLQSYLWYVLCFWWFASVLASCASRCLLGHGAFLVLLQCTWLQHQMDVTSFGPLLFLGLSLSVWTLSWIALTWMFAWSFYMSSSAPWELFSQGIISIWDPRWQPPAPHLCLRWLEAKTSGQGRSLWDLRLVSCGKSRLVSLLGVKSLCESKPTDWFFVSVWNGGSKCGNGSIGLSWTIQWSSPRCGNPRRCAWCKHLQKALDSLHANIR